MNRSDLYRFAVLNNWRKGREKYPRPNPYEDGSEFDDEFDEDEFELDETGIDQVFDSEYDGEELTVAANDLLNDGDNESESDEECMMELKAEWPMFDEENKSDDEVGDYGFNDDEFDEGKVVEKEVVDKVDGEIFDCEVVSDAVVDEKFEDDFTSDARYPNYLFSDEKIARLYKLDVVHEKDSIAYGIPDNRLEKHDGFFIRDIRDYYDISDIDLNINEHAEKKIKKKGGFSFFSRMFSRIFKKQ